MTQKNKTDLSKSGADLTHSMVERLSLYLSCLIQLNEEGKRVISSIELGRCADVNPAAVRRDIIRFGSLGKKGLGYSTEELIERIQNALNLEKHFKIALVGAGHLGTALAGYEGLKKHGFEIALIFDADPAKIGRNIGKMTIQDVALLQEKVKQEDIQIGIIAVPEEYAQSIADKLVRGGTRVIVNYAPSLIQVPDDVKVHNTNPALELLHTLYFLSRAPKIESRDMKKFAALILGGGRAVRLGREKPVQRVGKYAVIERQVKLLKKMEAEIMFIANKKPGFNIEGVKILFDEIPHMGPVGGIYTGIKYSGQRINLVIAGDMPFISRELIDFLILELGDFDAVVPYSDSGLEPLMAVYTTGCLKALKECLDKKQLRMVDFLEKVNVNYVGKDRIEAVDHDFHSFFNINTPEDLDLARKIESVKPK